MPEKLEQKTEDIKPPFNVMIGISDYSRIRMLNSGITFHYPDLPYIGQFTVLENKRLKRGFTKGLSTYNLKIDLESTTRALYQENSIVGYLIKKDNEYFLEKNQMEITQKHIDATKNTTEGGRKMFDTKQFNARMKKILSTTLP